MNTASTRARSGPAGVIRSGAPIRRSGGTSGAGCAAHSSDNEPGYTRRKQGRYHIVAEIREGLAVVAAHPILRALVAAAVPAAVATVASAGSRMSASRSVQSAALQVPSDVSAALLTTTSRPPRARS